MESNIFFEILKNIPQKVRNFTRLSMGIAADIDDILKQKKMSQKMFADLMEKKESEISKWLSGSHNFTIKSIAKIEEKLNTQILFIASEVTLRPSDERKVHTYMQFENLPLSQKVVPAFKVSDRHEIPVQQKMQPVVLSQTYSEAMSIDAFHNYRMS
jgi:transcriptional regulator with XRE-family HTH domain